MILKTTKYFDAEATIAACERAEGHPVSQSIASLIRTVAPYIEQAYEDGYRAGLDATHGVID